MKVRVRKQTKPKPTKPSTQIGCAHAVDAVIKRRLLACLRVLRSKRKEYTGADKDPSLVFENFEIAARISNTTPGNALWGMLSKHLAAVVVIQREMHQVMTYRMLGLTPRDFKLETPNLKREVVAEKFTDLINYLLLLEAMGEYYGLFSSGQEQEKDNG